MVGFMMVSIVPHIIFRFLGRRGFYNVAESSYEIQNPFKKTERRPPTPLPLLRQRPRRPR